MRTLHVRLSLNQFKCLDKAEGWSNTEPYLWNIFFKIDGSTIVINDQFRLEGKPIYHFSTGSHGNLNAKDISGGDSVGISEEVGTWETALVPLRIPYFEAKISGVIGVVSVLMEQNLVSAQGAEAGHEALNKYVKQAIDSSIEGFDPRRVDIHDIDKSVKRFFDAQVRDFSERIGPMVSQAVANAQNVVQNILSLVKKDIVIGYKVWDFSSAGIEAADMEIKFSQRFESGRYGDWEIKGRISAKYDNDQKNAINLRRNGKKEEEE